MSVIILLFYSFLSRAETVTESYTELQTGAQANSTSKQGSENFYILPPTTLFLGALLGASVQGGTEDP